MQLAIEVPALVPVGALNGWTICPMASALYVPLFGSIGAYDGGAILAVRLR